MKNHENSISLNKNCEKIVNKLISNSEIFQLKVYKGPKKCTIIDAGISSVGSIEAGLEISKICLGGLGQVEISPHDFSKDISWSINVRASHPVLACLGSQYAGWSLNHNDFFSLGSGPGRAIAQREDIFKELKYKDNHDKPILVLEVDKEPPIEIVEKVSNDCKVLPKNVCFILTPTTSISGNLQVISRVLEVAIHKVHELGFPLERIINGMGQAPVPPVAKDMITGMGRTNDSIIYGGTVCLSVSGPSSDVKNLAKDLPSFNSKDYGKPFEKIFKEYNGDFYKIDGALFSPAKVIVNATETGETFISGKINSKLVEKSFFNHD